MPYVNTIFSTKALATVSASCFCMGTATTDLLRSSWNVRMYYLPASPGGGLLRRGSISQRDARPSWLSPSVHCVWGLRSCLFDNSYTVLRIPLPLASFLVMCIAN